MEFKIFRRQELRPSAEQKNLEAKNKARENALSALLSTIVVEEVLKLYWETINLSETEKEKAIGPKNSPNRLYWYATRDLANYFFDSQRGIVIDEEVKPNQETVYDPDQHWNIDGHAQSGDKVYYAEPRYLYRWVEPDTGGTSHLELLRRTKVTQKPTVSEFFPPSKAE